MTARQPNTDTARPAPFRRMAFGSAAAVLLALSATPADAGVTRTAVEPNVVRVRTGGVAATLDALAGDPRALSAALASQLVTGSRAFESPVVALRLGDLPLAYAQLAESDAALVSAAAGPDAAPAAWYEQRVADLLGDVLVQARSAGLRTLSIANLPVEPSRRVDADAVNANYDELVGDLDVLLTTRVFIMSASSDADAALGCSLPKSMEHADARPIVYPVNRTWRLWASDDATLDTWSALVLGGEGTDLLAETDPGPIASASDDGRRANLPGDPFTGGGGSSGTGGGTADTGAGGSGGGSGGGGGGGASGGSGGGGGGGLGGGGGSGGGSSASGGISTDVTGSGGTVTTGDSPEPEGGDHGAAGGDDAPLAPGQKELMMFHWTTGPEVRDAAEALGVEIVWSIPEGVIDPTHSGTINVQALQNHIETALDADYDGYVMLDLEEPFIDWLKEGPEGEHFAQAEAAMLLALQTGKQARPNAKWTVYAVPSIPVWLHDDEGIGYRWANAPDKLRDEYLATASAPTTLLAAMDWFAPTIYDAYVNEHDWWWSQEAQVSMVITVTQLCVELAQGRKVLPTVWHRVHDSNPSFSLQLWSQQEFLSDQINPVFLAGGDGVVWWGADQNHYNWGSFNNVPDEFDDIDSVEEATEYFRTLHMNTLLFLLDAVEVQPSF